MERGSGFGSPVMVALAVLVFSMVVMVPEVSATRWTVGSNMGWTTNFNYTVWAQGKHFYNGDWLCHSGINWYRSSCLKRIMDSTNQLRLAKFMNRHLCVGHHFQVLYDRFLKPNFKVSPVFVYDRNQMDILEVNKTDYESCNSDHPLHNWTRGAGRDVVPLNVTRNYYFISGKGFCYGGMKLAVHVENPPPPPTASPLNEKSGSPSSIFRSQYVLPTVFAIGALWDAFVWFW
ncbi:lamin-like protein [Populus alba x Populus x berolinensis]|uniref:Lamin-like protein n=1 Tax=Populus alba x Populus x berolinensis TaxID=444605 RepID=A0AAD6LGK9_9ROSI|nr:lamin-like protein [Populus alba x Populus x berolinensis]